MMQFEKLFGSDKVQERGTARVGSHVERRSRAGRCRGVIRWHLASLKCAWKMCADVRACMRMEEEESV